MKLTKQQKFLGGVMIAGLVAVGVDHLAPRAAIGAEVAASDLVIAKSPIDAAASTPGQSLSTRLQATASCSSVNRGAFELSSVWQTPEPVAAPVVDHAAEVFAAAHKLTATLTRADRSGAVIDGKLYVVGQTIDGFKLLSVTGRTASLSNGRSRINLAQTSR